MKAGPWGEGGGQTTLRTPCFDALFSPLGSTLKACYRTSGKRKPRPAKKSMPTVTDTKQRLITDFFKVKACCCRRCLAGVRADPTYLQNVAQWRHAWELTGQTDRRNAVMNFMARLTSMQSTKTADSTSLTSVQSTKTAPNDQDVIIGKKKTGHIV